MTRSHVTLRTEGLSHNFRHFRPTGFSLIIQNCPKSPRKKNSILVSLLFPPNTNFSLKAINGHFPWLFNEQPTFWLETNLSWKDLGIQVSSLLKNTFYLLFHCPTDDSGSILKGSLTHQMLIIAFYKFSTQRSPGAS